MSPDPTAAPRPAKDGTQPPAQPWGRRDVRYVAAFISGRRSLWPASFSELLSSGFPLVKKPELKRTRESSEPSQQSPGSPWPSVSSRSLLALQKPRPAFCPRRSWCGARVSAPHNQPLDRTPALPILGKPQASPLRGKALISERLGGCYPPCHTRTRRGGPGSCIPFLSWSSEAGDIGSHLSGVCHGAGTLHVVPSRQPSEVGAVTAMLRTVTLSPREVKRATQRHAASQACGKLGF